VAPEVRTTAAIAATPSAEHVRVEAVNDAGAGRRARAGRDAKAERDAEADRPRDAEADRPRDAEAARETADLAAARAGDEAAFTRLLDPHRRALHAHCYRMLGSVHDADDALQDALLGAWRGLAGFEGRSSLRSWLYRVATNACLRVAERRGRHRVLAFEHGPSRRAVRDLGEPVTEAVFVEPYPDDRLGDPSGDHDPAARYEQRESVELAFVAALQMLPSTQRAVLVLRDVLAIPAAEVAETLDTSVAAVNSALQRARRTIQRRLGADSQQSTLRALGDDGQRALVGALVRAWERHDIDGIVALLAEDVRLTMPPLPAWYDGRSAVRLFFVERLFKNEWRVRPTSANGQLAIVCDMRAPDEPDFYPRSITVLSVRGREIVALDAFLDPAVLRTFGLDAE
jgi:RNA polymerase sigma-70 factor (TIGR02960 family)